MVVCVISLQYQVSSSSLSLSEKELKWVWEETILSIIQRR